MSNIDLSNLDAPRLAWLRKVAITCHVQINPLGQTSSEGLVYGYSPISHMMYEAQHASFQEYSKYMLPLLGAFSALDQAGECYSNRAAPPFPPNLENKSNIIKAIHYFASISVNTTDSDALYGLRNGLAHSSRLVSIGTGKKPKHYWFTSDEDIPDLFTHPATPWDGSYNTRTSKNMTKVNPKKLTSLVEDVMTSIGEENMNGNVNIVLKNGLEDLLTNYVFLRFDKSPEESYQLYLQGKKQISPENN